jgi:hypothetical protein
MKNTFLYTTLAAVSFSVIMSANAFAAPTHNAKLATIIVYCGDEINNQFAGYNLVVKKSNGASITIDHALPSVNEANLKAACFTKYKDIVCNRLKNNIPSGTILPSNIVNDPSVRALVEYPIRMKVQYYSADPLHPETRDAVCS